MPVFGKKTSKPNSYAYSSKGRRLRQMKREEKWNVENSPLKIVNARLGRRLGQLVKSLPKRQNRPNIVVEWGCGNANALFELATKHPDKILWDSQMNHTLLGRNAQKMLLYFTQQLMQ